MLPAEARVVPAKTYMVLAVGSNTAEWRYLAAGPDAFCVQRFEAAL